MLALGSVVLVSSVAVCAQVRVSEAHVVAIVAHVSKSSTFEPLVSELDVRATFVMLMVSGCLA